MTNTCKYVVFDLDETLGYFTELGIIWNCVRKPPNKYHQQQLFNKLCDIFIKDYFRPGIFKALRYLKAQKNVKVILYTNNTGELSWLKLIINFMEHKSETIGLFTTIVPGFKPNVKGLNKRKTPIKTYYELIRCAKIPAQSHIIFFDDRLHQYMKHKNVTYNRVAVFYKALTPEHIIKTLNHNNINIYKPEFVNIINNLHNFYRNMNLHQGKRPIIHSVDILTPLQHFLKPKFRNSHKTVKHSSNFNKTRKRLLNTQIE